MSKYNLKKMKVKRRGMLPALQAEKAAGNKVRVIIDKQEELLHDSLFLRKLAKQINQSYSGK